MDLLNSKSRRKATCEEEVQSLELGWLGTGRLGLPSLPSLPRPLPLPPAWEGSS